MNLPRAKVILIFSLLVLCIGGLVMLYSASSPESGINVVVKQAKYMVIGAVICFMVRRIHYKRFLELWPLMLGVIILFLSYLAVARVFKVNLPLVAPIKGAYRWLKLPGFNIQPSEFAKPIVIMFLAWYYGRYQRYILNGVKGFFLPLIPCGLVVGLIFAGKNLSITVISFLTVMSMVFIAGARLRWFFLVFTCVGLICAADFYLLKEGDRKIFEKYRVDRLTAFREPENYKKKEAHQLWRSLTALAHGGEFGCGFGESVMKNDFLPESNTDFILSVIGEEMGFWTLMGIFILYLLITGCGFRISAQAGDYEGAFLAAGISINFFLHALVNYSVMCGFGPTTGVTAPFVSYGGSSVLSNMIAIGLLLSVERESRRGEADSMGYSGNVKTRIRHGSRVGEIKAV